MSKAIKYEITNPPDFNKNNKANNTAIALALVYGTIATVFSTMVFILKYCFPGSLDGTYLKLFF